MPWNEEIRAAWARQNALRQAPGPSLSCGRFGRVDVRAVLPRFGCRLSSSITPPTDFSARKGKYVADHIPGAKYVELPGRNAYHSPNRGGPFQEVAEFLTGQQGEVADDRVLATVLFTDIVDSTRRAAEMGDRDWRALLDAHDAVVRAQLAIPRPRGQHLR